jgi:hypothetical protein
MLPLLWRDCSVTLKLSGSASGGFLGLLVTHRLRRCRLSRGCPTIPQVDSHLDSLSRLIKHRWLSIVHLLSRCSSHRDNSFHLVRGRWSSLLLVWSVARRATLLGSVPKTVQLNLPSRSPTLAWSRGRLLRRKCQWVARGRLTTLWLRRSFKVSWWWLVCLPLSPHQHLCYLILEHRIHSWGWGLQKSIIYLLLLSLWPIESALRVRRCLLTPKRTPLV